MISSSCTYTESIADTLASATSADIYAAIDAVAVKCEQEARSRRYQAPVSAILYFGHGPDFRFAVEAIGQALVDQNHRQSEA